METLMCRRIIVSALLPLASLGLLNCDWFGGAGDVNPPPPLQDAAADTKLDLDASTDSPAGSVTQKGVIKTLSLNTPVDGAKITCGASTTTTDASGKYQISVDPTKPFNMRVEKAGYYTLTEQASLVKSNIDLARTSFLSEGTANILIATLDGYDPAFGVISISVENNGCASEAGATLEYTIGGQPVAGATLYYTTGNTPSRDQKAVEKDSFPSAVLFNVPPNQDVTITVKHPTCTMIPFPYDQDCAAARPGGGGGGSGTITYVSSAISALPGKATSFVRVYLK
jgi:hypothetical protein